MKILKTASYEKMAESEDVLCSCSTCGHSFMANPNYEQSCPSCDSPRVTTASTKLEKEEDDCHKCSGCGADIHGTDAELCNNCGSRDNFPSA